LQLQATVGTSHGRATALPLCTLARPGWAAARTALSIHVRL